MYLAENFSCAHLLQIQRFTSTSLLQQVGWLGSHCSTDSFITHHVCLPRSHAGIIWKWILFQNHNFQHSYYYLNAGTVGSIGENTLVYFHFKAYRIFASSNPGLLFFQSCQNMGYYSSMGYYFSTGCYCFNYILASVGQYHSSRILVSLVNCFVEGWFMRIGISFAF